MPDLPPLDTGAERLDPPDPLVPGIERIAVAGAERVLAGIRRADAARLDPDEQLARRGLGIGEYLDPQIARCVEPGGAHQARFSDRRLMSGAVAG